MKKIVLLFIALCTFAYIGSAQTANDAVTIKVGTQLVYDVVTPNASYQFIITIKKLTDGVTFDWQMTAPMNKKGTIEMTKEATETATELYNYFTGGTVQLTDKTSVWVSQEVWNDMHDEDEMAMISIDGQEDAGFFRENGEDYKVKYNGSNTTLKTSQLSSLTDTRTITVWENQNFPIILSMDLGWTITLKEIK